MHRRKSSKDKDKSDEGSLLAGTISGKVPPRSEPIPFPASPRRNGAAESPDSSPQLGSIESYSPPTSRRAFPPSAGPYRTNFGSLVQSPSATNGFGPPSPLRTSFPRSHARTLSSSGAPSFRTPIKSPSLHGSLSTRSNSFTMQEEPSIRVSSSSTEPALKQGENGPPSPQATRRNDHRRIHSRNLSLFFPRPGSLPASSIAEDGAQEIEYTVSLNEAPVSTIPSGNKGPAIRLHNPPGPKKLGEGFTFGGRTISTSSTGSSSDGASINSAASNMPTRRGHHHKHSLSHNFFSFLEPGAQLQSPPSQSPGSPWNPISPIPSTSGPTTTSFVQNGDAIPLANGPLTIPKDTLALSVVQFLLGASLWVSGQQNGSLACTGLGYWVAFDAFGVALEQVVPVYFAMESMKAEVRRPYGNARMETVLYFAQTIYLIFSAVYICKETVEHLLLSVGEGHHHHRGDEEFDVFGMHFPLLLIVITIVSLISTSLFYGNHRKLIRTSAHKLPFLSNRRFTYTTPSSPFAAILANPFTLAPLTFSISLLSCSLLVPPSQHRPVDLLLAAVETIMTFSIAYPAAVVQGAVLLQTSPDRGMPSGRMEAFLRTMREIERHPLVVHLPAPHIWQLTPTSVTPVSASSGLVARDALVVCLELHVRRDTDDNELIELTRWAHDRCKLALGGRGHGHGKERPGEDGAEVTVGIVRG